MSNLGQLEEAFVLAKTALKNDMKSHVCWHVFGLLYRAEKNYEEALKSYTQALRFDKVQLFFLYTSWSLNKCHSGQHKSS